MRISNATTLLVGIGFIFTTQTASAATNAYIPEQMLISGKKEVELIVPTNGVIQLGIVKTIPTNAEARIKVAAGRFQSDRDGSQITARTAETNLAFPANELFATVTMQVPPLLSGSKYKGIVVISGADFSPLLWPVTLMSGTSTGKGPGTLVLDQTTVSYSFRTKSRHAIMPKWLPWRPKLRPQVNVTLHEKNRTWPIHGITIGYGPAVAPEHSQFDIGKNVVFFLNGAKITNIAQWPRVEGTNQSSQSISENGHAELCLAFSDMAPGQYSFELKVQGANSLDDPQQQKLTVNLKVAHTMGMALLTLIAALLVSFFAYKWLNLYRQRLEIQKRVDDLCPDWLLAQRPTYAVVWVRTVLEQAKQLASKLLLVSPAVVTSRIDRVVPVLEALDEARKARLALQGFDPLIVNRFEAVIADNVRSISDRNMDKAAAEKAESELATLATEIAANRWMDRYWHEVQKAVDALLLRFNLAALTPESQIKAGPAHAILRPDGKPSPKPATVSEMVKYEEVYAKLKLLVERQKGSELGDLLAKFDGSLDEVFAVADDAAWRRIKEANLIVTPPPPGSQAYQPLYFEVKTSDSDLNASYLFRRGLRFQWTFDVRSVPEGKDLYHAEAETFSPRVVQYVPEAGQLTVKVKIVRQNGSESDAKATEVKEVTINKSSEIGWHQSFENAEAWSLVIAAVFALISGLLTFYYKNPTFGSVQDYLGLFLWGVGVEQTKNFLQAMKSSSP